MTEDAIDIPLDIDCKKDGCGGKISLSRGASDDEVISCPTCGTAAGTYADIKKEAVRSAIKFAKSAMGFPKKISTRV